MKHVFPNAPFKISSKIVLKECHLQLSIARQNFSFGLDVSYTLLVADFLGYPGKRALEVMQIAALLQLEAKH